MEFREFREIDDSDDDTETDETEIDFSERELTPEEIAVIAKKHKDSFLTIEERDKIIKDFLEKREQIDDGSGFESGTRIEDGEIDDSEMPWKIESKHILYVGLKRHPEKLYGESIEDEFHRATIYCELMELLNRGEIDRTPKAYKEFAKKYKLHRKTVTDWAEGKRNQN